VNIAYLLDIAAEMDPDRVIATDEAGSLTLAQLRQAATRLAAGLAPRPPGPVAFLGVNGTGVVVSLFAAAYAGRPFSPLNFRADDDLLAHFVNSLGPAVVIADPAYRSRVDGALGTEEISTDGPAPAAPPDGLAVVIFTSGTSGRPKPVRLRHENLSGYVMATVAPMSEGPDSATLNTAPNYHIASIANLLTSTFAGRRMVFLPAFSAPAWLALADRERVTHAFVVPTMLYRIVAELEAGGVVPGALTTVSYGGSAMPRGTIERALRVFPPSVGFVNAYGLTETSSTITVLTPEDHRRATSSSEPAERARLGSVGRPIPGIEIGLADDGEILVSGGQITTDASSRQIDGDGRLHTGDLGRIDADGYLFVLGRADDMIIRGGENISPVEIEDVLRSYPDVRDAVVVGVADPEWGQRIHAVLESDADLDADAVSQFARQRLPGFKCPERYLTVRTLPRNDMGKVVRRRVGDLVGST
jgi:acyl-CoA synthetase (AMP-forming)/AMP-acid ligase II